MLRRVLAFTCWAYLTWILLTWTRTASQLVFGLVFSAMVGAACSLLGTAVAPWSVLAPRRALALARLAASAGWRVVMANLSLARRIWLPTMPLRSGMVVVPTKCRDEAELTAVALVTSVIVDNQIVDLDRHRHELQYHAVWIDSDDPRENYQAINGPIEAHVLQVAGAPRRRAPRLHELEDDPPPRRPTRRPRRTGRR